MLFIYDAGRDLYVGELFTVTLEAYNEAVDELVEGGMEEGVARALLLDEAAWRPDMAGAEESSAWPRCLFCRRPLWGTQMRLCDAACEAGFIVEARL